FAIYPLSLHDALPISPVDATGEALEPLGRTEVGVKAAPGIELSCDRGEAGLFRGDDRCRLSWLRRRLARRFFLAASIGRDQEERSEEHTSELQSLRHL